jgi:subtilisin family serine protease
MSKRIFSCLWIVIFLAEFAFSGGIVPPKQDPNNPEYVKGEILVKFKDETQIRRSLAKGVQQTGITAVDQLNQKYQVEEMEKVFKDAKPHLTKPLFKDHQGKVHEVQNLDKIYKLKYKAEIDPVEISKEYAKDSNIEYAEPNYIAQICAEPNDPYFDQQWGLPEINAPEAWEVEEGDTSIIIGIIDTGVDWGHPDLVDKVVSTGYDFVNNDNDAMDDNGHGSHVAGIAAATTDNGIGIAGVAWNCKILPVKVMQSNGTGSYSDVANGVIYAANNGAKIINLSLGGYAESYLLRDALENAYTTTVIVAAAGNGRWPIEGILANPFFPAAWPFVIGVEAGVPGGGLAGFSNYDPSGPIESFNNGLNYEMRAPGVNIYSTIPLFHPHRYSYASWNGTSMAAPFVTGTVALLRSHFPSWSNEFIMGQLVYTSDPIVNAYIALTAGSEPQLSLYSFTITDTLPGDDRDRIADAGETVELVFDIQNNWSQAYNVEAILRPHSYEDTCFVTILDSLANFGGGVSAYAHVNNESNPFLFYVKPGTPNNTDVYFDYEITCDGEYSFHGTFYIKTQRGIEISGIIREDRTLTNDYLYIVTGNVLVDTGVTLTIEPGTRLQFDPGWYLRIDGCLVAIGTENSMIVFTSNEQNPAPGDWAGIRFTDSSVDAEFDADGNYVSGSIIKYAEIELGSGIIVGSEGGATCSPYIAYNYIHDNKSDIPSWGGGGICLWDSPARIEHNLIQGNGAYNNGGGIYMEESNAIIACNTIEGNWAENLQGGGIYVRGGNPIIIQNVIRGNYAHYTMGGGGIYIAGIDGPTSPNITYNQIYNNYLDLFGIPREGPGGGVAFGYKITAEFTNNTLISNRDGLSVTNGISPTVTYNNILSNRHTTNEYNIHMLRGSSNINAQSNYWGTTNTDSIDAWIWDYYDDFDLGKVIYQPFETTPVVTAPGFLYQVQLNPPSPIGCEVDTFTLIFSKPMDISIQPNVKFGVTDPYTQHEIEGDWIDSTHWQGTYTFSITTGDGINRLRVTQAKDCEGMEIPKDTRFAFVVDATGAASEGFIAQAGIGKVDLAWQGYDLVDLMGYNMYRYHKVTDTTYSEPILVNTSMITDTVYSDKSVTPDVMYYYMYTGISTDFTETDYSDPVSAIPFDADPGDANGDMAVNVLDIIAIVSYMIQDNPQPFLFNAANMNNDGVINVLDIIGVVNAILGQGTAKIASGKESEAIFCVQNNRLISSSTGNIAGYQFKIGGDIKNLDISSDYPLEIITRRVAIDTLFVLAWCQDKNYIPEGNCPILSFSENRELTFKDLIVADIYGRRVNARFGKPGELLVPDEFSLAQNFPNPFNSTTIIKYTIPKTADVHISIYNLIGQRVYQSELKNLQPGYYEFTWDGKDNSGHLISSGLYFYQLKAGTFIKTKKMMLVK